MTGSSRSRLGRTLLLLGRIALGIIFIAAAIGKMRPQAGMPWTLGSINVSLSMFAMNVDSFQMLPAWAVNLVAHWLPPFELFLGIWLLSGIALRLSSLIATLLLVGFISAITRAYMLHLGINCGCFGPGEAVGPGAIIRDGLGFLPLSFGVTIGAFLLHPKSSSTASTAASAPVPQRAD
jgi:putative oxidoreductase